MTERTPETTTARQMMVTLERVAAEAEAAGYEKLAYLIDLAVLEAADVQQRELEARRRPPPDRP